MRFVSLAALLLTIGCPAAAQRPDPAGLETAQREAMAKLSVMNGVWRGTAWTMTPTGRHDVVHTERIGPMLGGTIKVIEGRAYNADGTVGFNAFGIVSYDPARKAYSLHSYAMGHSGDFALDVRPDGYVWQTPAGPGAVIRYTATIGEGAWREVGERIAGNAAPVKIFEMNLKRVGDSRWPGADAVPMK
jgi:hypothetical protein